jgi:hypothetical protein
VRTDKFVKMFISRGGQFANARWRIDGDYLTWNDYGDLAELTGLIDFGCNFDRWGCKKHRFSPKQKKDYTESLMSKKSTKSSEFDVMCCCCGCWSSIGHTRIFPNDMKAIKIIANRFKDKVGFWRPDGCALPRKYRPPICLAYRCSSEVFPPAGRLVLKYLHMSKTQVIRHYSKRTGKKVQFFCDVTHLLKREIERELDENRADANQKRNYKCNK